MISIVEYPGSPPSTPPGGGFARGGGLVLEDALLGFAGLFRLGDAASPIPALNPALRKD